MRLTQLLALAFAVVALVVAWPRVLGGATSYVVVSGVSMEPTYETGDLVVVRRADQYRTGQVISFATADGPVIHRIVGGDADAGFVTRGDNVDRDDPYRPTPAEIHGRAVAHVPALGGIGLRVVRTVPAPLLVVAAVVLAFSGGGKRRGRGGAPPSDVGADHPGSPLDRPRAAGAAACVVAAVVVFPSAVLSWAADLDGTASLVGVALPTAAVRWSTAGILVGLAVTAVALLRAETRARPELWVQLRHGALLVELAPEANVGGDLVRVSSIDELARLARRDDRWILHQRRPDGSHQYLVPDAELTYEFVLDAAGVPQRRPAPSVPDDISELVTLDGEVVATTARAHPSPELVDIDALHDGPPLRDHLPVQPVDLPAARVVVVEDLDELTRIWMRDNASPGRVQRRRLPDGTVRHSIVRNGREFVHVTRSSRNADSRGASRTPTQGVGHG